MKMNQFDWTTGLDESGWIATALFVIFFIIVITTVVMMVKLHRSNNSQGNNKNKPDETFEEPHQPSLKASANPTKKKDISSNPIEEAEVFLTYGLNKQAVDVLEKHLKQNPSDKTAREMLARAQTES